jgi:hypothetical protein
MMDSKKRSSFKPLSFLLVKKTNSCFFIFTNDLFYPIHIRWFAFSGKGIRVFQLFGGCIFARTVAVASSAAKFTRSFF